MSQMAADIVIIGNGISGITAADAARQNNREARIIVISNEAYHTYYRLKLCELLAEDKSGTDILIHPSKWYEERNVEVLLDKKVVSLSTDAKNVALDSGEVITYNKLVISCGSSSNLPDISDSKKNGTVSLWSLSDVLSINQILERSSNVVISGGGLLGLEAAYHLSQKGFKVSIIEYSPHLLSRQLDINGSLLFEKKVNSIGIDLYLGAHVKSINGIDSVEEIVLDNGSLIKAELLLFAAGVKPNTDIAGSAGIKVNRGIVVDKRMMTSDSSVYACGDVAEFEGFMPGQWITAMNQGKVAGINASGGNAEYSNERSPYFLNTMGIKLYSIGDVGKKDVVYDTIEEINWEEFEYQKVYFEDNKCTGGIVMGNIKNFNIINSSIKDRLAKEEVVNLLHKHS